MLLLSSLETSVVTAESSERDAELRGGEAADFIAFDHTLKTILLNVLASLYSIESLIGSSGTTENKLKLHLAVCNLSPSSYHLTSKVRV